MAVWNSTPERADALAGEGITPVRDVGEAVRSSPLVVDCVSTYEATHSALGPAADRRGATLFDTYAAGASAGLTVMRGAGQRARVLAAATENLALAEAAGLGTLGFSAQTKVIGGADAVEEV